VISLTFQGTSPPQAPSSCGTDQTNPSPLEPVVTGPANNIAVLPFPFASSIAGTATSLFRDTGYGAPEYLNADPGDEQFTLGTAPGAGVTITYQGAPEDLLNLGTPSTDASAYSPWVSGSALDSISGFRFIRFRVCLEFAPPPYAQPISSFVFPAVQGIQIDFRTPLSCP